MCKSTRMHEAASNMRIEDVLADEARYQAERMQSSLPTLTRELVELQQRKAQIKEEIRTINSAQKRLRAYRPAFGPNYQCPRCWVQQEIRASLHPIPSRTKDDILRCDV
jgi:DNA repair exonuclease SbcCD ATPase subunit